jgi:hypothetical protein
MRTTLNIDDDVLFAARELARRDSCSLGQVISYLARQALVRTQEITAPEFFGFRPFPSRGGIATNELVNRLRDATE